MTYSLNSTDTKTASAGSQVTAPTKSFTGYILDKTVEGTKISGTVTEDNSLVLKVYYRLRNDTDEPESTTTAAPTTTQPTTGGTETTTAATPTTEPTTSGEVTTTAKPTTVAPTSEKETSVTTKQNTTVNGVRLKRLELKNNLVDNCVKSII